MSTPRPGDEPLLREFAAFLRASCLDQLAAENLRLARQLDVPLMRLYEHLPEEQLLVLSRQGLDNFLGNLEAGTALAAAAESLRLWERDELPGLRQDQVEPGDLVLLQAAQKQAFLACIGRFTQDPARMLAVVQALEGFYIETQHNSFKMFARLREKATDQAREREREFRTLAERSPDIIARWDLELRHVYVNPAVLKATGQGPEAFLGKTHLEAGMPPQAAAFFMDHLRRAFETGQEDTLEFGDPGGSGRYYLTHLVPEPGPDGRPAFVLGVTRDITERRQAEHDVAVHNEELVAANEELIAQAEELERQRQELALERGLTDGIIDNMPGIFAFYDRDVRLVRCNRRYAEVLGKPMEELVGRHYDELVVGSPYAAKLRGVLDSGVPWSDMSYPGRGLLEGRFFDFTTHPLMGPDGRPAGVLMQSFEVTERVRMLQENERLQREQVEQLLQVDRQKDQFLGILSHELRTPLNAILGFASVMADEVSGPLTPTQHQHMGKILGGTEVLLALINDLLDMSRIQAGKFSLTVGPMAPGRVVAQVAASLASLAAQKAIKLVNDVPAELPTVQADEQRVAQMLRNLVGNAIKFTPEGGTVTVRASVAAQVLRVEVSDTGPGIRAEDQGRLFQPFTQLDMSATRAASGTGLGLSIVKALAEAHGGEAGVESAPGQGSTFWFSLPVDL